ncbi:DNA polymerase delta subunit 3 isoform X1 [Pleurodeles waltl]|uniref:DNA polymerase delta subunit 3 isoform X1 n=2 Tax=Pleurodeles waltl TaxID=8319 RepID=UPI0037096B96
MDELYLENIDEYVTDQNKIVTYKWLSYTLGVHVNQAKQMLYDYVERKRKENSGVQLHVTYLVTGKHVQNGYPYHKVAIVKEEKLEAVKSKLAVVSSVHVYSIQKAVLKDSGPLFSTDYDIIKANLEICNRFSAIQCTFAVRRAPSEITKSHKSSQESNEQQVTSAPKTNGHGLPPSSKATSQPPKGIMGMFAAKGNSKTQTTSKDSKPEVKEAPQASTASSKSTTKSNTVNNFFGKASMKKKANSELEQMVKEEKSCTQRASPEPETEVCMSSTADRPVEKVEEEPAEQPVESPIPRAESAVQQKKGKKSKVKRSDVSDSDDEKTTKKKRRRIKKPVSESSEDEDAPASPAAMEELPSKSPPRPAVKAEPESLPAEAQPTGKKRKRRRVLKSHTFMDEEGCIVTEKRYETESCTDSESESVKPKPKPKQSAPPAAKQEPKASKKGAAASSRGGKQASIMGFFQKK